MCDFSKTDSAPAWVSTGIGSMGPDHIAGNPIEIGLLNGRVTKLGKAHRTPTPANFAITAALMPHEHGAG